MTITIAPARLRAGMLKAAAVAAISLAVLLPALGAAGAARADDIVTPVEVVQPLEALVPTGVVEPIELAEPIELVEPTDLAEPVEPTDLIEPAPAVEPAEVTDNASPIAPLDAAESLGAPNALDPISITAVNDFRTTKLATTYDFVLESLFYNDSDPSAVLHEINDPSGRISVVGTWLSYDMTGTCVCPMQFQYRTISGSTISNWATVYIEVIPNADTLPIAYADSYTTPAGVDLNLIAPGVLSNDVGGSGLGVWGISDQTGEVFLFGNGNLLYSPPAGFVGTKSLYYQVKDDIGFSSWAKITILVTPGAAPVAPVASNDTYTTPMNTKLDVVAPGVLVNDSLGQVNSLSGFYPGIAALDPTGAFSYEPPVGFSGTVVVNYTIIHNGLVSNVASITVTVTDPGGGAMLPADPTDPKDPGTPVTPQTPGGTVPAETPTVGGLAHAGATTAWLVTPAAATLLLGCLVLGVAAHRRRASN